MPESDGGNQLASVKASHRDGRSTKTKRKAIANKVKSRLKPLHVCMGLILLVLGILPFANLITVRQFVHDHPILSFVDFEQESESSSVENTPSDWAPPQAQVVLSPVFDEQSSPHSTISTKEKTSVMITDREQKREASKNNKKVDHKITVAKSPEIRTTSQVSSMVSSNKPLAETEGIFGSFLEAFGISNNKKNDRQDGSEDGIRISNVKKKQRQSNDLKASTTPCKDVFLFMAVREDSYLSRQLYRNTWLHPNKWVAVKGGKTNPMAEELPSIAYRFFIVENESEDEDFEINHLPGISDIERKMKKKEMKKHDDVISIPMSKSTSTLSKQQKNGQTMSPTVVRNWIMNWVLKHTEFRFMLLLDLGKSSPIVQLPVSALIPPVPSKTGRISRKEFQRMKDSIESTNPDALLREGNGYSMVCVERIADELRYRPNERFFWGTQTCGENPTSTSSFSYARDEAQKYHIGFPERPKFQLFSQDVVELLTLAESKLDQHDQNKKAAMSSDALLAALKLTLLDDRLRIQDVSSATLLLHARNAVHSAKSEWYKSQHSAGFMNTSTFRALQQELTEWSKIVEEGEEGNKGDGTKLQQPPQRKKKNSGPEPVCKMMTMITGLTDAAELHALEASNTNRTKPWKQYRDQIMRLGPACDSAITFDDIGLTTTKVLTHTGSSGLPEVTDAKAKTALAYSFLDNDELFDNEERFDILQKCSIHGDCLWREITTTAVERWWHTVDNQRASRCYRSDAHSKGASCDAFKSRKFLSNALVEKRESSLDPTLDSAATATSTFETAASSATSKKKGPLLKRKQESGQKAVEKMHASGAVLASFPGSGNTWSRMLLEYASGYYTGSIYNDITLMPVLPAEGVRTHEVLAWKAHTFPSQYIDNYKPAKVVLLVRHPISALWSEFQRRCVLSPALMMSAFSLAPLLARLNVEAGSRGGGGHVAAIKSLSSSEKSNFKTWSTCMACRWIQYITAHLQLAQVIPLKILLFERLAVDTVNAMREVLEFLGVDHIDEDRLLCATRLADHPLVHRPPANFTMHDAFKSFPEQACTILRTIEQTDQGRLIMRLLGYGNSIKPPKVCAVQKDDIFACSNMLTEEFHGSKQCKLGSSSSSTSSSPSQQRVATTTIRGGTASSSLTPARSSTNSNGVAWKATRSTMIGDTASASTSTTASPKHSAAVAARAKYEASKGKHKK